jgi:hypothetical protein
MSSAKGMKHLRNLSTLASSSSAHTVTSLQCVVIALPSVCSHSEVGFTPESGLTTLRQYSQPAWQSSAVCAKIEALLTCGTQLQVTGCDTITGGYRKLSLDSSLAKTLLEFGCIH